MGAASFGRGAFGQVIPGWTPSAPVTVPGIPFGPGPGSIAYRALRISGYLMSGVIPEPEILQDCFDECNAMLDQWNANELAQQFIDDRYFNIPLAQQFLTVGPTGNLSVDANGIPLTYRPQRIIRANLVLLTNVAQPTRIPINLIEVDDWADIPVIAVTSQVAIQMWVQSTTNNTTLWMFPYPSVGNQLELFMWPGIAKFASQASVLDANPATLDAVVYNLAWRMYGQISKDKGVAARVRPEWLRSMAAQTKREFEKSNALSPSLTMDVQTQTGNSQGAPFSYLTGDYT